MVQPDYTTFPVVFGRYLLLRRLAKGGMGEVFLAKSGDVAGFERLFVIKKILPELARDDQFMRRFVDEAQIAIKLNHINIAHVFEVGMVGRDLFLALEYVEGRDLRRILSKSFREGVRLPQDLALFIAREVCNGLSYAHRRKDEEGRPLNLVHCDISPPNVLVSFEGEVKIIDFGVARSALGVGEVEPTVGFGKLGYMAPEQLLKGRVVDQRADIYAAGVVLYEMLVGDRMIQLDPKADHRDNVRKIVLDPVVPPSQRVSEVDRRLDAIVLKAVAKNPEDRYQRAAEFRDDIQRVLSDLNPTVTVDDLAAFVRALFADELSTDQDIIRQAHATDIEPFREEMNGAMEETVSYAVTTIWEPAPAQDVPPPPPPPPPVPVTDRVGPRVGVAGALPRRSKRLSLALALGAGALGLLLVVAVAVGLVRRSKKGSRKTEVVSVPASGLSGAMGARGPGVTVPADGGLVAQARPSPTATEPRTRPPRVPARQSRPRPRVLARHRPVRVTRRARTRPRSSRVGPGMKSEAREASAEDIRAMRARLSRKLKVVAREYSRFRARYGQLLEDKWQAVLHAASDVRILGPTPERIRKADRLINSLRRQMAKIRRREGDE